jgi:secretion/DNA translocation related TadE-like protein
MRARRRPVSRSTRGRRRFRDGADDAGAGGVLALAIVAAVIALTFTAIALGAALVARQRVVAAADASALAAADALLGAHPGAPCGLAAEVAAAHRVALIGCELHGAEALVTTGAEFAGLPIRAESRAGPAP